MMTKTFKKTTGIFLICALTLFPSAHIDSMQSSNYAIDQDSINFGGTEDSSSASYRLSDTMGEVGTGESAAPCASASFDGTDDYVRVSNNASLNLSGDYTISMWVYNQAGSKSYPTLLNRESQSGTNGFFWIYTGGTNEATINYQYANGSTYGSTSFSNVLGLNTWNHLVFTFVNATKTLTLYLDGQDIGATRTLTNAQPVDGGDLYLGGYQGTSNYYPFKGYLDDVRIYNRTLSSAEATGIFTGAQIDATGLLGHWGFDEGSGTSVVDRSGNGNTGTLIGAVFSTEAPASTCKVLSAGYRQMTADPYIAITMPTDVTLSPNIGGVTGGTGDGSTNWTVTTDAPAGYQVSVRATSSPALVSGGYNFADYTPAGAVPDYDWSVASTDSEFGFTVEGGDTVDKFLDDGNDCNAGTGNSEDKCWLSFTTSDQAVAGSESSNHPLGTSTTLVLRAQSGASHIQQDGTYTATIIVTAVAL